MVKQESSHHRSAYTSSPKPQALLFKEQTGHNNLVHLALRDSEWQANVLMEMGLELCEIQAQSYPDGPFVPLQQGSLLF